MASKSDPTVKSTSGGTEYPEGTHPARPASEVTHSASNWKYKENPDKPDDTSIAQVQVLSGDEAGANP